jgi:hypothetical protein
VRTLLVAATGGHLSQLVRLEPRLGLAGEPTWVTFDTAQSRELLAGRDVVHAHYTRPRDLAAVARNVPIALRLLRRHDRVVSTGSGIALSFLPQAAAMRREAHYVESAARATGPSVTGRALALVPGVRLYTQYPRWAAGRWRYAGSVFDAYRHAPAPAPADRPLRVALSVGTLFPFPRLVERLRAVLPEDAEVLLWQAGDESTVPPAELRAAFRAADAVVVHSGVGAALEALDAGRRPLLVPRLRRHGEHVDDHQLQVAGELRERGLAVVRDADELRPEDLAEAAGGRVEALAEPPPLELASFRPRA